MTDDMNDETTRPAVTRTSAPRPRPRPTAPAEPADGATDATPVELSKPVTEPTGGSTATVAGEPEGATKGTKAEQAVPGGRSTTAMLVSVVGLVLVVALTVLNVWLLTVRRGNDDIDAARSAALDAVRSRVPAILSYRFTDVDTYAAQAPQNLTGPFRGAFSKLVDTVIVPAAKAQKISTTATVQSVGVIDASSDQVILLVLIDQSTTSKTSPTARLDGSRARVILQHVNGTWLISNLTPI